MNNFTIVTCAICLGVNLVLRECLHLQNVDDASNFGYVGQAQLGTANNSTASGITQQMSNGIYWMPVAGPIVEHQLVLNHKAHLMENKEMQNG